MRPVSIRAHRVLLLVALLSLPLLAVVLEPLAGDCVVKRLAGFACPGCGLGHALQAAARFDIGAALAHYPPLPLLGLGWLIGVAALARWALVRSAPRRDAEQRHARQAARLQRAGALVGVSCAAVVVANWIITLCA